MSEFLKGNFKPQNLVNSPIKNDDPVDQFEREALRRLGGSITFVARKKFIWDGDEKNSESNNPMTNGDGGLKVDSE